MRKSRLCICLSVLGLFLVADVALLAGMAARGRAVGSEETSSRLLTEAERVIDGNAVFAAPGETGRELAREGIGPYLRRMDPFSDYLTASEYERFRETRGGSYVGVGMELEKTRDGGMACYPLPGGPAELAGVKPGDHLESIDGIPVQGKSLYAAAAMTRGVVGSRISMTIEDLAGNRRTLTIRRASVDTNSITIRTENRFLLVRIRAFTSDTGKELDRALADKRKSLTLVIDIRGNRGGDLIAAVSAAGLFLKKDTPLVTIRSRTGERKPKTVSDGRYSDRDPILWQDERTASAAEVFAAALTGNGRAVSIGRRTFGKGKRQDVFPLSDGSALVLTTAFLGTPAGEIFEGVGVLPTYFLNRDPPEEDDFRNLTRELSQKRIME